jgi:hypothetical protein
MSVNAGIVVKPVSMRYDEDDDRWRDQVADLVGELRFEGAVAVPRQTPVPGTKGITAEIILALGSAGVFSAVVETLRVWLSRDKTRSLELTYTNARGETGRVVMTATNAGSDIMAPILEAAARQIGGSP